MPPQHSIFNGDRISKLSPKAESLRSAFVETFLGSFSFAYSQAFAGIILHFSHLRNSFSPSQASQSLKESLLTDRSCLVDTHLK